MDLKSTEYSDIPLFHSVDLDHYGDGFVFTYLPELKVESESTMQTLFPLNRHHNTPSLILLNDGSNTSLEKVIPSLTDKEIGSFFTQETVDCTSDMYFDTTNLCIVDPLIDNNLEFVLEDDAFDQLLGQDTELELPTGTNTPS